MFVGKFAPVVACVALSMVKLTWNIENDSFPYFEYITNFISKGMHWCTFKCPKMQTASSLVVCYLRFLLVQYKWPLDGRPLDINMCLKAVCNAILLSRRASAATSCLFYQHGLTLIPTWIYNHTLSKVWHQITYPVPNFNGEDVELWEWISNFTPHFIMDVITCPCWD